MAEWRQEQWGETEKASSPELSGEDKAARDKALYYLQFSGKTESELRRKLAEQGFSPASVDQAVAFLKAYRYLDDEDYVRRYIERNRNRKSRKQISCELGRKGISREILETVLEDEPLDEAAQIEAILIKRRYAGETASREEKQKTAAYLARKGFSYDAIQTAMSHYGEEDRPM